MTPESLWQEFVRKFPEYKGKSYDTFTFGDKPDDLLHLVLTGQKTATCCIYRGGTLGSAGDISIVLDAKGDAQTIIETTNVSTVPFNQITEDFARKEGEGNKTLASWRKIHLSFWGNIPLDTPLECEEFKLLYQNIELEIHETTEDDLKNIQGLWNNKDVMYWVGFPKGLHKTMAQLHDWLRKLPTRSAKHYSIYEKSLGYCGETAYRLENKTAIMDIKLLPIAQGHGIGQKALQFALVQAFQAGAKYAQVTPFEINNRSIHLYRKLGFKQKKRIRQTSSNFIPPCEYVLEMIKNCDAKCDAFSTIARIFY